MQIKLYTDPETLKLMGKSAILHFLHHGCNFAFLTVNLYLFWNICKMAQLIIYFQVTSMHLLSLITEVILIGLLDGLWVRYLFTLLS